MHISHTVARALQKGFDVPDLLVTRCRAFLADINYWWSFHWWYATGDSVEPSECDCGGCLSLALIRFSNFTPSRHPRHPLFFTSL